MNGLSKVRRTGVGLITFNRPEFYQTTLASIRETTFDSFVIVNDGDLNYCKSTDADSVIFNNSQLGVSKTKNKAIQYLLNENCTDIFIFEDDTVIKNVEAFDQYIATSEISNIPHLCFGPVEITHKYQKNLKLTCMYSKDIGIDMYHHPQGGLMYFNVTKLNSNECLFDENYFNAFEHIDISYNLIKQGKMPPFWYFPDIHQSSKYIESISSSSTNSTITNKENYQKNVASSAKYFTEKWGLFTNQIPEANEETVIKILRRLRDGL